MSTSPVPAAARRAAVRVRALATVSCLASTTALLASLSACGGSGGAAPSPPPPAPAPAPTPSPAPAAPIAAQMTVPTPVGYDAQRLAAFNRLNEIRLSAGLGMVAQNALLDQAAQAHADWMIANDAFVHTEASGTPGFTGADWWNRDEALGYVPVGGSEAMSSGVDAIAGVDELVNGVYHRAGLLAFEPVDVGVGWSANTVAHLSKPLVVDIAVPGGDLLRDLGQLAQPRIDGVSSWPLDGARSVPTHLGFESPNPVPSADVMSLGSPVSIVVASSLAIDASSFVLTDATSGMPVATMTLTNANDPNFLIPHSFVAIVPLSPLLGGRAYSVAFEGVLTDPLLKTSTSVQRSWSFSTAPQ